MNEQDWQLVLNLEFIFYFSLQIEPTSMTWWRAMVNLEAWTPITHPWFKDIINPEKGMLRISPKSYKLSFDELVATSLVDSILEGLVVSQDIGKWSESKLIERNPSGCLENPSYKITSDKIDGLIQYIPVHVVIYKFLGIWTIEPVLKWSIGTH